MAATRYVVAGSNRANNPPDTFTRTSHSISIEANGTTIGLIQTWSPTMSKAVTPIYELNIETSGIPYENIPGNLQNLTIQVARYDVWTKRMEQAFGTPDIYMLSNQKSPFSVQERWVLPDGSLENWSYDGCWFESIGRSFRSDDQRLVMVNATLRYLRRTRL